LNQLLFYAGLVIIFKSNRRKSLSQKLFLETAGSGPGDPCHDDDPSGIATLLIMSVAAVSLLYLQLSGK